jgi:hypothetical protein
VARYCGEKTANLIGQDVSENACPGGTTYTYDDAGELTGQNGSTTGWSHDNLCNETTGASAGVRTNESWTDHSRLAGITTGGRTYDLAHACTSKAERTKLGSTRFHPAAPRRPRPRLHDDERCGHRIHPRTREPAGTPTPTARPACREAPPPRPPSRTGTRARTPTRRVCPRRATATAPGEPRRDAARSPGPPGRSPATPSAEASEQTAAAAIRCPATEP